MIGLLVGIIAYLISGDIWVGVIWGLICWLLFD